LLQNSLRDRTWMPGCYNTFTIYEPKERLITAAPFADRAAHHAIMNVVEPYLERFSIHDSYACCCGKGLHAAVARAKQYQQRYPWFLKLDIRKYFESIDHGVLLSLLERLFKDRDLLELLARIVHSSAAAPGKGLPIGNLTSRHFANFYLGYLDHFVKDELGCRAYVRYMDDFRLWADSKEELKTMRVRVEQFLSARLKLEFKESATRLAYSVYGMPFLGFRLFPHTIRLKRESLRRFASKVKRYDHLVRHGRINQGKAARAVESIYSFVKTADGNRFLTNYAATFAA
jgi:retron-type reverse transcriptase